MMAAPTTDARREDVVTAHTHWFKVQKSGGSGGEARRERGLGQMTRHFPSRVERWGEKIGRPNEKGGQGSEV
jgi:hypothetical protein